MPSSLMVMSIHSGSHACPAIVRMGSKPIAVWILLVVFALAPVLSGGEVVPKGMVELVRPKGEHLPEVELQTAMSNSVHAGVLRLIEMVHDPKNTTGLVYPFHSAFRSTGEKKIARRYRIEKQNVYEEKEIEQLKPVKDGYGNVTGYAPQKVKVRVSDKVIRTVDVEIPDPQGQFSREITVSIGDNGGRLIPRGWYGMNAQGLYLLCRAGLGKTELVGKMADELENILAKYKMPDTTWDLAWLAMGFMAVADGDAKFKPRVALLLGRLIDGTLDEGDRRSNARGLWGPVCISNQMLAKYFQLEMELNRLRLAAEQAPDTASKAQRAEKSRDYQLILKGIGQVERAQAVISQQGRRLADIEKPFGIKGDGNEDDGISIYGLSYYIYNRMIVDLDSTAVASMALEEANRRQMLPEVTVREQILGRQVIKSGIRSRTVLQDAYKVVSDLAGIGIHDGGAQLCPIHAFDGLDNLIDVPLKSSLPSLLRPETWRSNLSASAALYSLSHSLGQLPSRDVEVGVLAKSQQRTAEIVQSWLAFDPNVATYTLPHAGETDNLVDLSKNQGWPNPTSSATRGKSIPVQQLPVGYQGSPRELLEPLMVLHGEKGGDPATSALARQISYRLIIEQLPEGNWKPLAPRYQGPMGVSSGEWAYLIGKLARYHLWQTKDDRDRSVKDPINSPFQRQGPYLFRHANGIGRNDVIANVVFWDVGGPPGECRRLGKEYYAVNLGVAETLSALLYLSGQLMAPVTIDPKEIDEIKTRSDAVKKAHEQALLDVQNAEADEVTRLQKIANMKRSGPQMTPSVKLKDADKHLLWDAILAAMGLPRKFTMQVNRAPVVPVAASEEKVVPADRMERVILPNGRH